ncbi:MAG: methyltransferase [Actinomycetaceae bacterium]|nr:methyltransferase [Actinomycetaceae bacterium]
MSSEHYFSSEPSSASPVTERLVHLRGREYSVATSGGVFSSSHLDKGTAVLLSRLPEPDLGPGDLAVDVGCGWGPITLALAAECDGAEVWGVDINARARDLASANLARAGLDGRILSPDDAFGELGRRTVSLIWSNPPVRIGKAKLHELLSSWLCHLAADGAAYFVVHKNLGADSLQAWLTRQGWLCDRLASSKGFRILAVRSAGDDIHSNETEQIPTPA